MQNKEQLQKLALAKLTHEFRAPLNAIMGFTSILLQNKWDHLNEKELLYLNRILYSSRHLLNLANGIMHLSKGKNTSKYEHIDVAALIRHTAEMFEGQALEKNIKLNIEMPKQLEPLLTLPEKLKIILINLLSNAIKFTPSGTVTVHIHSDPKDHTIKYIDIKDTGYGISEEQLTKLMQPLSLSKEKNWEEIDHLGLPITCALCDQLNYRLEAKSVVGKGSTFRINLAFLSLV